MTDLRHVDCSRIQGYTEYKVLFELSVNRYCILLHIDRKLFKIFALPNFLTLSRNIQEHLNHLHLAPGPYGPMLWGICSISCRTVSSHVQRKVPSGRQWECDIGVFCCRSLMLCRTQSTVPTRFLWNLLNRPAADKRQHLLCIRQQDRGNRQHYTARTSPAIGPEQMPQMSSRAGQQRAHMRVLFHTPRHIRTCLVMRL